MALCCCCVGALRIDEEDESRVAAHQAPFAEDVEDQALMQTTDDLMGPSRGDSKCPCISPDLSSVAVAGGYRLDIDGKIVVYPELMGSQCHTWDKNRYPGKCTDGSEEAWCAQKWCYVDPCNCDMPLPPKRSTTLPSIMYAGKPLFYSYATCGSEDFTRDATSSREEIDQMCHPESHMAAPAAGAASSYGDGAPSMYGMGPYMGPVTTTNPYMSTADEVDTSEIDEAAVAAANHANKAKAANADAEMKVAHAKIHNAREMRASQKVMAKQVKDYFKIERQAKAMAEKQAADAAGEARSNADAYFQQQRDARREESKAMQEAAIANSKAAFDKQMSDLAMKKSKDLSRVKMRADAENADVLNKAEALKREYDMEKFTGANIRRNTLSAVQAQGDMRRSTVNANKEKALATTEAAAEARERAGRDVAREEAAVKEKVMEVNKDVDAPIVKAKKQTHMVEDNIAHNDEQTDNQIDSAETNARDQSLQTETRALDQKMAIQQGAEDEIQVNRDLQSDAINKAKVVRNIVNNAMNEDAVKTARLVASERTRQSGEQRNAERQVSRYADKQEAEEIKETRYKDNAEEYRMQGNMDVSDANDKRNKATQEAKMAEKRMFDAKEKAQQAVVDGDNAAEAAEDRAGEQINNLKQQMVDTAEAIKQQEANKNDAMNNAQSEEFQIKKSAQQEITANVKAMGYKQYDLEKKAADDEMKSRHDADKATEDAELKVEAIENQANDEIKQLTDETRRQDEEYENTIYRQRAAQAQAQRMTQKLKEESVLEIDAAKKTANRKVAQYQNQAAVELRKAQAQKAAAQSIVDQVHRETVAREEAAAVQAAQDQHRESSAKDAAIAAGRAAAQKEQEQVQAEKERQQAVNEEEHDKQSQDATARKAIKEQEAELKSIAKLEQERAAAKEKSQEEINEDKEKAQEELRNEKAKDGDLLQEVENKDKKAEEARLAAAEKIRETKQAAQREMDRADELQQLEKQRIERMRLDQHSADVQKVNTDKAQGQAMLNMARDEGARDLEEVKENEGAQVQDLADQAAAEKRKADETQRQVEEIRDSGATFVKDARETGQRQIAETREELKEAAYETNKRASDQLAQLSESVEKAEDLNAHKLRQLKNTDFEALRRAKDSLHDNVQRADRADSEVEKLRAEMDNAVAQAREQGAAQLRNTLKEHEDELKATEQENRLSGEEDAEINKAWKEAKDKAVQDAKNREADYVDAQEAAQATEDAENSVVDSSTQ